MSNNVVLFSATDASGNTDLWVTDGTAAGTSEVTGAGLNNIGPSDLTLFGSEILFRGYNTASHHSGLWVTDGTPVGTSELSVAGAGAFGLGPSYLTVVGTQALFTGTDSSGNYGLWVTNGTAAGTSEISVAGAYSSYSGLFPYNLTVFGSEVLFSGKDTSGNVGLWVTNGTSAGTTELSVAGAASYSYGGGFYPRYYTVLASEVLFEGWDASGAPNLWVTDGTSAGTSELSVAGAAHYFGPTGFTVFGSEVLFSGQNASGNSGLWVTNGTAAGTSELSVAGAGSGGLFALGPTSFTVFGSEVLFAGWDSTGKVGLWVTNGTAAGTSELSVAGAYSGGPDGFNPGSFTVFGNKVLFEASDSSSGTGLWVTDGTSGGTSELHAGLNGSSFKVFGSEVLFAANGYHGFSAYTGLWVTDGTAAGTSEISNIGSSYSISGFTAYTIASPAIVSVSTSGAGISAGNGDLGPGSVITLSLNFSNSVTVANGVPTLALADGGVATYQSGSGTPSLNFTYTVGATGSGQNTPDLTLVGNNAVNLNGAIIQDAFGNAADLSGANGYNPAGTLIIDTTAPVVAVTGILPDTGASPSDGLTNFATVTVRGTIDAADAGLVVSVFDGGKLVGTTTTTGSTWSLAGVTLAQGGNSLTAQATDAAGNTGTSAAFTATLDTTAPTISSVALSGAGVSAGNGDLGPGSAVTLTVTFSEAVTVAGGVPTLALNDGGTATYQGGSGTTALTFTYTVGATGSGQNTAALALASSNALSLNGAAITDAAGNAADLGGANGYKPAGTLVIDTTLPVLAVTGIGVTTVNGIIDPADAGLTVSVYDDGSLIGTTTADASGRWTLTGAALQPGTNSVTAQATDAAGNTGTSAAFVGPLNTYLSTIASVAASPASGVESAGQSVAITLTMSSAVTVSGGTPTLTLNDGGTAFYDAAATAALGDPTRLVFSYTVGASSYEHNVGELVVQGGNLNGATMVDSYGNPPDFSNLVTAFPGLQVMVAQPATVTSVLASPASGVESAGQTIAITVGMSGAVTVSGGTPTLTLNDGGTAYYNAAATAALGDPTKLVFDYTVASSAYEHNVGELVVQGGGLNGAAIVDGAGNAPDFSNLVTAFPNLQVVVTPPTTVTSVAASPASGVESAGQTITITLAMSGAVTVSGGTPTLALNDGGTAIYDAAATAALGDPTRLVFSYTVGATDRNVAALAVTGGSFNGASITDAARNSPDFSNDVTVFPSLAIVQPTTRLTSVVASPGSGVETAGQTIAITLSMSKAVTVSGGIPTLTLNDGGTAFYNAAATAALGDPTRLVFSYTVGASSSEHNVGELVVQGGSLNGATIVDGAGNTPDFSGLVTTFPNLAVNAVPPATVTSIVTSPVSGVVGIGQTITLTLDMSKAVTVSGGTPAMFLNDGGKATYDAPATAALGDPTRLVFDYKVGATDKSVSALAVTGGSFNGATVVDAGGNGADFSGTLTSFPIQIENQPVVTSVTTTPASGEVTTGSLVAIDLHTSEAVTASGTPTLLLNDGATAAYSAALSTATDLAFVFRAGSEITSDLRIIGIEGNQGPTPSLAITDASGHPLDVSGAAADLGLQVNTTSSGSTAGPSSGTFGISNGNFLELFGPSTAAVNMSLGTLKLDDSQGFAGTVAGFAQPNYGPVTSIDLADIAFGAHTTLGYAPNAGNTGGVLTVSDGIDTAHIQLLGSYSASSFVTSNDRSGHTLVSNAVLPTI